MMKLIFIVTALSMTACSSLVPSDESLKNNASCMVWKDGPLGTKTVVEVEGEVAKQKMTCWILDTFACTYTDYTFRPDSNEILSSLPPADKAIGKLEGRKITNVNMTGITVDPFELGPDHATYDLKGPIGPKVTHTVEYNSRCTPRQASLGLFTVIGK